MSGAAWSSAAELICPSVLPRRQPAGTSKCWLTLLWHCACSPARRKLELNAAGPLRTNMAPQP